MVWYAWLVCVAGRTVVSSQGKDVRVRIGDGWSSSLWNVMPWIMLAGGCI